MARPKKAPKKTPKKAPKKKRPTARQRREASAKSERAADAIRRAFERARENLEHARNLPPWSKDLAVSYSVRRYTDGAADGLMRLSDFPAQGVSLDEILLDLATSGAFPPPHRFRCWFSVGFGGDFSAPDFSKAASEFRRRGENVPSELTSHATPQSEKGYHRWKGTELVMLHSRRPDKSHYTWVQAQAVADRLIHRARIPDEILVRWYWHPTKRPAEKGDR